MNNIFADIPDNLPDELIDVIVGNQDVKIERIVSRGHTSPDDFWYDQDTCEFVFVVSGEALLQIEGKEQLVRMKAGDYRIIPAHERHRVEWTAPDEETVWLSVHF